jgi:hypothetical protein
VGNEDGAERDQQSDVDPRPRNRREHLVQVEHARLRDVDGRILERPRDQVGRQSMPMKDIISVS